MSDKDFDAISWNFDNETGIGEVTLDRPEAMNAIDATMQREIIAAFEGFRQLDEEAEGVAVSTVIMDSAGEKAFSSGLDLDEMQGIENYYEKQQIPNLFSQATDAIESYDAPVIASVDGICLGGGFEFAMACDFRLVSEESQFGQPEVNFGLLPGGGAAQRLSTIIGVSQAKKLCMTGEQISSEEAHEYGAVDEVHPADDLNEAVRELAETFASKPPLALRGIKEASNMTRQIGYDEAIEYGGQIWVTLSETRDHTEGMEAFAEDRNPEFEGR